MAEQDSAAAPPDLFDRPGSEITGATPEESLFPIDNQAIRKIFKAARWLKGLPPG